MKQNKARILVVDDCIEFCEILSELINMQPDMEIVGVAYEGKKAIEMIMQKKPDLVILDYLLPDMNGPVIVAQINKSLSKNKIKFILATAVDKDKLTPDLNKLGIDLIFFKPMNLNLLIEKMRDCIFT